MSEKLSLKAEVQKKLDMVCGRLSYALNSRYPKENYIRRLEQEKHKLQQELERIGQ